MVDEIIDKVTTPGGDSNIDRVIKKYILEDHECGCKDSHTPGLRRRWACIGCRQLSNLKLIDPSIDTTIFETPITHTKISPSKIAYIQSIISKNTSIQSCTPDIEAFKRYNYLSMDPATLDIINRYLVNQTVKPKLTYRCGDVTTSVYDNHHDLDSLLEANVTSMDITCIIEQLIMLCRDMSRNKLVHNNPIIKALRFKPQRYSRTEDSITIKGDYEVLLDKFGLSSGQLGDNIRTTNVNLPIIDYQPDCKIVVCRSGLTEFSGVCSVNVTNTYTSYTFDPKIVNVRMSGLPLFHESLDLYGLMVILMTRKRFYDIVMSDRRLRELWLRMWDPVEYFVLIERITKHHIDPATTLSGFDIISGLRLRCDVIDRCFKVLWG